MAEQVLGLNRKGSAASFVEHIHPDDRLHFDGCLRNLRPDNPSYAISYRYLRPDGKQVWLESTGTAEFDEAGRTVRIRGLRADITERKRFEEELVEARKAVEQANGAKSAFLAAASHDLRQPLQSLKILQGTLARQIHDSVGRKLIVGIDRSLQTMTDMLTSLLDINRLETGNLRLSTRDFPVSDILSQLTEDFRERATEKGLRWRLVRSGITVHS